MPTPLQVFQEEVASLQKFMQSLDDTTTSISKEAAEATRQLSAELTTAQRANKSMAYRLANAVSTIRRLEMESATGVKELTAARVWAAESELETSRMQVGTTYPSIKMRVS